MTAASGESVSPRGGSKLARNAAIIVGILLVGLIALLATRGTST